MKMLQRNTPEWYREQINCARLLQEWAADPDNAVIRKELFTSMEKLNLIVDAAPKP